MSLHLDSPSDPIPDQKSPPARDMKAPKRRTRLRDLNDDTLWQVFYFLPAKGQDTLYDADGWMAETLKIYWLEVQHIAQRVSLNDVDRHFPRKKLETLVLTDSQTLNLCAWVKRCPNLIQLTVEDFHPHLFQFVPNIQCLSVEDRKFTVKEVSQLKQLTHLTCWKLKCDEPVAMPHMKSLNVHSLSYQILQLVPNLTHLSLILEEGHSQPPFCGSMLNPVADKLQFLRLSLGNIRATDNIVAAGNIRYEFPELRELVVLDVSHWNDYEVWLGWLREIVSRNNVKKFTTDSTIPSFDERLIKSLKNADVHLMLVDLKHRDNFLDCLYQLKELKNLTVIVDHVILADLQFTEYLELFSDEAVELMSCIKTLEIRYPKDWELEELEEIQTLFENSVKLIEMLTSTRSFDVVIKMMGRNVPLRRRLSEAIRNRRNTHPERFGKVRILR